MPDPLSGVTDLLKQGRFAPEIDSKLTPARDALSKARALMQGVPTTAGVTSPTASKTAGTVPAKGMPSNPRAQEAIAAARTRFAGKEAKTPEKAEAKEKDDDESPAAKVPSPPKMRAKEGRKVRRRRKGARAHILSR